MRRARIFEALALLVLALAIYGQAPASQIEGVYEEYAVAADHPLGSEAGAEILAAGGNAADAAAATMLALGVVSPASSGLGGGGFALYYRAEDQSLHFIDFREEAPAAATDDMFVRREGDDDETAANRSRVGGLAVGVPGEPAGIEALITRFGSGDVTRAQIVAPAIRYAQDGFEISAGVERSSRWAGAAIRNDPVLGRWFTDASDILPAGRRVTNPTQAQTLRTLARQGFDAFYRGRIAREIVRRVREKGGIMTAQDLADYEVVTREPVVGEHFGYRWVSSPPPSAGGVTMLASLALLERWMPAALLGEDNPRLRHALAESWKGPYTDRQLYLGDPDHVDVPTEALLSDARVAQRAPLFHPTLAHDTERYDIPLPGYQRRPAVPGSDAGTSHLCVVDAEGNVASVTTTVNLSFGARFTAAGIVMNDEMDDFAREVGEPNAFGLVGGAPNLPGPGRRPVSSMSPTIIFQGGDPVLCLGAAGGSRIITATEQVALFSLLFGDTPSEALARRRVHHQGAPSELFVEEGLDPALRAQLEARGHVLREIGHSANVQMIRIDRDGERVVLRAASDPRKGGHPAGR